MTVCSEIMSMFEEYLEESGGVPAPRKFPVRMTKMIKTADGSIAKVIMRRDESRSDADYDIEDMHPRIPRGQGVRRIDPAALDAMNAGQQTEGYIDERAKPKDVTDADGTVTHHTYGTPIARRTKDGKVQLNKNYYDYSHTTRCHRNKFLGHDSKELARRIKSGEYEVVDFGEGYTAAHHRYLPQDAYAASPVRYGSPNAASGVIKKVSDWKRAGVYERPSRGAPGAEARADMRRNVKCARDYESDTNKKQRHED
jgi:hypothetical protein